MKPVYRICSRLLGRSSRYLNHPKASHLRCFCNAVNNCDPPESSSPRSTEKLQELLDEAAQGLGPGDEVSHEDEWRTSPYPQGAVINPRQSQSAKSLRPNVDPSDTSIILFPGYGSQHVGMGRELVKFPAARDIFDASSAILKMDVLKMMLNGPKRTLDQIKYAEPLIFICSLAALEKLKEERPWAIENCVATAGFSVGEITALTFAGVFSFADGLKLVNTRANAIELACDMERGGMAVVNYNASSKLREAIAKAKEWCSDRGINKPECVIATYLNPNMKIISGHTEALSFIKSHSSEFRLRVVPIHTVHGAVHTELMKPAADVLKEYLSTIELSEPSAYVYSNVTAKMYSNLEGVRKILPNQICKPLLWEQLIHKMFDRKATVNVPSVFTCGPQSPHLKFTLAKVNMEASRNCIFVY